MQDPSSPYHAGEGASEHDGPFIVSSGLFGRAKRAGRIAAPVNPSMGPQRTHADPAADPQLSWNAPTRPVRRSVPIKLVVFAAFIVVGVLPNVLGDLFGSRPDSTPGPGVATAPESPGSAPQGRYDMRVEHVDTAQVTLLGVNGNRVHWGTGSSAIRSVLEKNRGENVLIYWRRTDSGTIVVGVRGPRGTVLPFETSTAGRA